jgi:hypothetical protein
VNYSDRVLRQFHVIAGSPTADISSRGTPALHDMKIKHQKLHCGMNISCGTCTRRVWVWKESKIEKYRPRGSRREFYLIQTSNV